jgi:hypothetical protein
MLNLPGFHSFLGSVLMIEFDEIWCVDLIGLFPGIIALGVPFPFDEVLQGLAPPPGLMGTYLFYFVFFFAINQIWWRSGKVWSMR